MFLSPDIPGIVPPQSDSYLCVDSGSLSIGQRRNIEIGLRVKLYA